MATDNPTATSSPNVIPLFDPGAGAKAAQFIDQLRDGTVIDENALLSILPVVFEEAIACILSELDYERNLECKTAIAVRILAIWAARAKDSAPKEVQS